MFPKAKKDGVVHQRLDDELIVYDYERHLYHYLNDTAAFIWTRCDGCTSIGKLAEEVRAEGGAAPDAEQTVRKALDLLGAAHLLTESEEDDEGFDLTRREFFARAGAAGAPLLGAVVLSVVAPTVAQAQSNCSVTVCTSW